MRTAPDRSLRSGTSRGVAGGSYLGAQPCGGLIVIGSNSCVNISGGEVVDRRFPQGVETTTPERIAPNRRRVAYQAVRQERVKPNCRLRPILRISGPRSTTVLLHPAKSRPACRESIGAETGSPHRERLFRVKLTPCFPVVVELARSRTGREPEYFGGDSTRERGLRLSGIRKQHDFAG